MIIVFIVATILLMTVVSGVYVFVVGCVRRKELPWLVEKELEKTPYKKYCKHIQDAHCWLSEHNAQDVWITSTDGLKLHGLWISADKPKGTVLFAHGYRSSPLLDFGLAFSYYHNLGFNLLVPDQRSHGKSQGCYITFGVKESLDFEDWIAYHNDCFGKLPLVLSGLSMGASTVLYLADRDIPDNVKGIIADCGFTSPYEILACVFRGVTHLPAIPSMVVAELCARSFAGFSLRQCDTRKSLANARVPVLMVHGKEDGFVPCEMSKQGYDACSGSIQLFLVDGADHGVSFLVEPEKYRQLIDDFLEKNLL